MGIGVDMEIELERKKLLGMWEGRQEGGLSKEEALGRRFGCRLRRMQPFGFCEQDEYICSHAQHKRFASMLSEGLAACEPVLVYWSEPHCRCAERMVATAKHAN